MRGRDRRRSNRIELNFIVEWGPAQPTTPGEVADISIHGLFIRSARVVPIGHLVKLRMHLPDDAAKPFECFAWVRFSGVTTRGTKGMGLELFALSTNDRARWTMNYHHQLAASRRPAEPSATSVQAA
jgi:hypothetical protein